MFVCLFFADLFGLFAFLRFEPFSTQHYWNALLYQPFLAATAPSWCSADEAAEGETPALVAPAVEIVQSTRLAQYLSQLFWRNTKALVGDQLMLPPVTEEIHWYVFNGYPTHTPLLPSVRFNLTIVPFAFALLCPDLQQ